MIDFLEAVGLYPGRMMSYSKTAYDLNHPSHLTIWNAWITDKSGTIIATGTDLDLTLDLPSLLLVAAKAKKDICLFYEQGLDTDNLAERIKEEDPIVFGEGFDYQVLFYPSSKEFFEENYSLNGTSPRRLSEKIDYEQNRSYREARYGKYFDSLPETVSRDYLKLLFWRKIEEKAWKLEDKKFLYRLAHKIIDYSKSKQKQIQFPKNK